MTALHSKALHGPVIGSEHGERVGERREEMPGTETYLTQGDLAQINDLTLRQKSARP